VRFSRHPTRGTGKIKYNSLTSLLHLVTIFWDFLALELRSGAAFGKLDLKHNVFMHLTQEK
jgi:hypothetical protein